jgi:hypothetical protein
VNWLQGSLYASYRRVVSASSWLMGGRSHTSQQKPLTFVLVPPSLATMLAQVANVSTWVRDWTYTWSVSPA